jgi:hypothetical protein
LAVVRGALLAAIAASLLWATPADARYLDWQSNTGANGEPTLNVRSATEPGETVEVFRCPAGGACDPQPLGWADESVGSVDVGASAPGDVFEARIVSADGAVAEALRTPAWLGTPTLVSGPAFDGAAIVGSTLLPVPGTWTGGWDAPWRYSLARLTVCRTPAGTDCMLLSYGRAVVLPAEYAGWYAFASTGFASSHGQPPTLLAAPPFPIASVTPGPTVAGPLGPITEPKRPTASVRKRARRAKGKLTVARVTCPERCKVRLKVSGHGKTIRRKLTVTGRRALRIPMRHGRLKVRVVVDGKLLAKGVSRARPSRAGSW